jgi:hypothetical protein
LEALQRDPIQVQLLHGTRPLCGDEVIDDVVLDATAVEQLPEVTAVVWSGFEDLFEPSDPVTRYLPRIYRKLKETELVCQVNSSYMEKQPDINERMRTILVDWLVDLHRKFRLRDKTLYLAVNLVDRVLERRSINRRNFQTLGATCMFIASKHEEVNPPDAADFAYMTEHSSTTAAIISWEAQVLNVLDFRIATPAPSEFLFFFRKINECSEEQCHMIEYILDMSLLEIALTCYKPSLLAAASIMLSNELLQRSPAWPTAMSRYTEYDCDVLKPCTEKMRSLMEMAQHSQFQSVRNKYRLPRYCNIATVVDLIFS